MTAVEVRDLVVGYGGPPVVRNASCAVDPGGFLAILGASGSGKTTLLRAIAGFVPITSGTVTIGDRIVDGPGICLPPEQRGIGIVTQDGSLFPHLTVARNVGFGLPRRRLADGTPSEERVAEMLEMVGLADLADRSPHELSGGQQQRVALARALAPRPDVVLLDEPFSALDAGLRAELGQEVRSLLVDAGATSIMVTHDQDEALSLATSVALIVDGVIVQQGTPQDLYDRPESLAVASFLGDVNVLPVVDVDSDGHAGTTVGAVRVTGAAGPGGHVIVRPEQIVLTRTSTGAAAKGRVSAIAYYGHDSMVDVQLPDHTVVRARMLGDTGLAVGDPVSISVRGVGQVHEGS